MNAVPDSTADQVPERVNATVIEALPNSLFRLRTENGCTVVGHVAGDLRMAFARLLPGDLVEIEISPLDRNRARIAGRRK
ncbi:MAG: translation initiation factor IF-1 [Planctomycetes bacterium]|nr:translation initiation factor IF-1 [Planctomycetota bacterium]